MTLVRVVVSNFSCWCLASGWKPRKGLAKAKNSPWLNVTIPNHEGCIHGDVQIPPKEKTRRKQAAKPTIPSHGLLSNLGTSYFILFCFVFNAFARETDTNHKM